MKRDLTIDDEKALIIMASENWGSWKMPCVGIGYSAVQKEIAGQTATIVTFDYAVTNSEGVTSITHRIYPKSNSKPGRVAGLRPRMANYRRGV